MTTDPIVLLQLLVLLIVIGAFAGGLSVLMGISGGSFGVPFMTLHAVVIQWAVATTAGFGLLVAVPSVIGFAFVPIAMHPPYTVGAINVPTFLVVVSMTLLTAPVSMRLAHATRPDRLNGFLASSSSLSRLTWCAERWEPEAGEKR